MPCHDSRNDPLSPDYDGPLRDKNELAKEWMHNSPVAEMLCYTLGRRYMAGQVQPDRELEEKIGAWWREHLERDKAKN